MQDVLLNHFKPYCVPYQKLPHCHSKFCGFPLACHHWHVNFVQLEIKGTDNNLLQLISRGGYPCIRFEMFLCCNL